MSSQTSRVKLSAKNTMFSFINYLLKLIMAFVVKTIFIKVLTVDFAGVNSLFTNILTVFSLAELGIGSAITFMLYKPVYENDIETVNSIVNIYRKLYLYIGLAILVVGLSITPFINIFINDFNNISINLYAVYLMFLVNSVFSYFMSYRFVLFTAYQRKDIEYKVQSIANIVSTILQLVSLLVFKNYYAYLAISIITGVFTTILTFVISKKAFPEVDLSKAKPLSLDLKKTLKTNVKGIFYHKISYVVMTAVGSLIISKFIGITALGIYSNYTLITTQITAIFILLGDSLRGSVGNLIAAADINNSLINFKKLRFLFYWLGGFCSICLFVLFTPFLDLWSLLGKWDPTINYSFDILTEFVIVVNFYIYSTRLIVGVFREGLGNFNVDKLKGVAEAIINIVLSLILVKYIGIVGILLGNIIASILTSIWVDPLVIHKLYFKKSVVPHLLSVLFNFIITLLVGAVTWFVCSLLPSSGLWIFIAKLGICAVLPNLLFFLVYFKTPEFKGLINMLKDLISSAKARKLEKKQGAA